MRLQYITLLAATAIFASCDSSNSLAADYNAAMSKFNYSFTNIGELPKGAEKPLPREFKPYLSK